MTQHLTTFPEARAQVRALQAKLATCADDELPEIADQLRLLAAEFNINLGGKLHTAKQRVH